MARQLQATPLSGDGVRMSAIQPIDVATPNSAMPLPPSAGFGSAAPGQPFADVMRSAVSPAQTAYTTRPVQTAQRASYPSVAPTSSRLQFNGASITTGMKSNQEDVVVSPSPIQPVSGKASTQTTDLGDTVESSAALSVPSAHLNGSASPLVEEQSQSSTLAAAAAARSSEGTSQQARTDTTEAGSSPAGNGRKQTGSLKDANKSQDASGSPTAAIAMPIGIASVPGIVAKPTVVNFPGEKGAAAGVTDLVPSKSKSIGSPAMPVNSSISNRATAPGLTTPAPQTDRVTGAAAMQPRGAGVSSDGAVSNPATTTNATATSSAGHNSGSEDFGRSHPASAPDGTSAHAATNGNANSSSDANTSNAVSATGAASSGTDGNTAVGSGTSGSIHSSEASKSGDFTVTTPMPATAAKDLPDPHANSAGSGAGLQASPGGVSSGNHSVAPGAFPSSTAVATTPRATVADAFTALDGADSGERGVLLHVAPHQVAVGVSDPSLGWVEVRAERISGQIAAALTTSSSASHAALTSVLPTMATYLQEHQAGVQQVHVESSLTGGQAGTGSQGQTASQRDAQTSSTNVIASSGSNKWKAGPGTRSTVPANPGANFSYDGHHFSIRA